MMKHPCPGSLMSDDERLMPLFLQVMLNEVLTWITILGCALSIISLVICLYVFTFVRGVKNLAICMSMTKLLHPNCYAHR